MSIIVQKVQPQTQNICSLLHPGKTMYSWEAVAGARSIGPGPTSRFGAHWQPRKKWLLLSTPISLSRIHVEVSKRICICRTQSCDVASLSPVFTQESEEEDDATNFSAIPSSLLAAEREEAKAVLKLFLRKQGMSNALAARTINKSDSFIDYLISKLHSVHKSRYMIGRELTTLEIRSALISYLESLLEEYGNLLIDMVENFPDPPGTSSDRTDRTSPMSPSSRIDPTSARDRAMARVIQLDEKGNLSPQVLYLLDLGMDLDSIQKIARQFPSFTYYSLDGKIKPVVELLLDLGVSEQHIPKILQRRPQLCGISLTENLKPTIIYLESIGVDKTQWGKVITTFPALLTCSRQKIKSFIDFLLKLGVPEGNIGKILTRSPRILSYSVEEKLGPVSEYFASLGIDVASLIQKCPQNFGLSIEDNLKPVTEFFDERGFSKEEIGMMVNRYRALYTLSLEGNLVPKWEYFLTMGYPRSELVKFPHYFGYDLERRIKPRFNRVRQCGLSLGLNRMLSIANSKFEDLLKKEMKKLDRSAKN